MLLELAVGDAYGAGFEYASENLHHNDLSRYVAHPRHHEICPGCYTDDTQMTLAVAELIEEGVEWTSLNIADKFVTVFKRDERTGYAGHFYDFLKSVKDGQEFLKLIKPASDKSGAAMRAAPIGILSDIDVVLERTKIQARLTHDTPDGIHAAQAAALLSHYFVHDIGPFVDVGAFIESHVPGEWDTPYQGKVKSKGWMSVRAAITAVKRNQSLSTLLIDCVNFTGDVDTVATIALAAASVSREYTQDLPEQLIMSLENGSYGRDYIIQLDERLLALL
ncbi:MAG: ADP-ribosylglycohydrolase family protein [Chloroflexi bacterium]|nr:ADP-ribosylglycohydrolase family protein [Chloroflexota bacterium]